MTTICLVVSLGSRPGSTECTVNLVLDLLQNMTNRGSESITVIVCLTGGLVGITAASSLISWW